MYRLRARQIEAAIWSRFDERLAERTRVARDIHDTLLQTIQGSKMVADHVVLAQAAVLQPLRDVGTRTWLANLKRVAEEAQARNDPAAPVP